MVIRIGVVWKDGVLFLMLFGMVKLGWVCGGGVKGCVGGEFGKVY